MGWKKWKKKLKKAIKPKNFIKATINPLSQIKAVDKLASKENVYKGLQIYKKVQKLSDPAAQVAHLAFGKKGDAIYESAQVAAGDYFTFGGVSAVHGLRENFEATQKQTALDKKQSVSTGLVNQKGQFLSKIGGDSPGKFGTSSLGEGDFSGDPGSDFDDRGFDIGSGFPLSGPDQDAVAQSSSGAAPSIVPFLLIGGGLLLTVSALRKG